MNDREQLQESIAVQSDALAEKLQAIEGRLGRTKEKVENAISPRAQHQQHPLRTVGIAFSVGLLVGLVS